MSRNYTVSSRINRPVNEVFAAVVEHEQLVEVFHGRSSGNLAEGSASSGTGRAGAIIR